MATKKKKRAETAICNDAAAIMADPLTLGFLAREYIQHLDEAGRSQGTLFSYTMELELAQAEIGTDTPLALVTEEWVKRFFESERVTKTKSGFLKAKPTVDKTRRVLRLALVWAVEKGWISQAPVPGVLAASA